MALEIKKIEKQIYTDFCTDTGGVFSSADWMKIYSSKLTFCGIFDNGTRIVAAFYYYSDTIAGISYLHCPPFSPYNGFVSELSSKNYAAQKGEMKKIMEIIAEYFDKFSFKSIVKISFPSECVDMQPFIWQKFKVIPNYTYQISLHQTLEEISAKMTTERRNDIKKATKDGVVVEKITDYSIVQKLIENTYDRKSMKVNGPMLNKILFDFANSENSFAFVAFLNGIPISTVFCIYDKNMAYYLLGGYDAENKHSGAGALAVWNAIQYSKSLNLNAFDFEGSMIQPVEKFFRGFGGDITPYYVINKANVFIEIILKFFKRELY